mmetsp:Transcript_7825/g.14223  ORF Transcript_7825/g.14223 Transcript_7825/m.14223 type:complete len:82 (+) Transcript_7825:750-995(+)
MFDDRTHPFYPVDVHGFSSHHSHIDPHVLQDSTYFVEGFTDPGLPVSGGVDSSNSGFLCNNQVTPSSLSAHDLFESHTLLL